MLKVIPPPLTTSCGAGKKCGEVYYQTTNFSILCIFCGLTTHNYAEFLEHFRHCACLEKGLQIQPTTEPEPVSIVVTPAPVLDCKDEQLKVEPISDDPLELELPFDAREVAQDADEEMRKLLEDGTKAQVKTETEAQQTAIKAAETIEIGDNEQTASKPITDSDEEFLSYKFQVSTRKLRNCRTRTKRRKDALGNVGTRAAVHDKFVDTSAHLAPDSNLIAAPKESQAFNEYTKCTNSEGDDEMNASLAEEHEQKPMSQQEVDWSKPYEPNLLKSQVKRPYKPRNKPNTCTYCGRTFRRRYQLDTHLNIHTGSKPHQCEVCGRQFRAVTTLTRHLGTHETREAYQCKYCEKCFTHRAALLSHELRHTQERHVPCDECDKHFYTENQMDTHKRKVHHKGGDDSDALPFACDLCTKRYRSASMLSTHRFKKHYRTAKFVCEQCGKKFVDAQQLERHKSIHVQVEAAVKL